MENNQTTRERTGLRAVRVMTNMLMLTGSAAALGLLVGASPPALAAICLYMAAAALAADQIQHRVRSFRIYIGICIGIAALTALLSSYVIPSIRIPLTVISLAEIWCLYEGRITQRPAFAPKPYYLLLPIFIWMLGTFSDAKTLRPLSFAMETALVLLFLAWHNQKSLERTYYAASGRARVPYGKIRRLNASLLFVYLAAALLLCAGLTAVCSDDGGVFWVLEAFLTLVAIIAGALVWLFIMLLNWLTGGNMGAMAPINPLDPEAAEELFPWLHTLWIIIDGVIIVAGAAVVIYLIYWNLYNLYYGFLAADPETGDTGKRFNARERKRRIRAGSGRPQDRFPILAGLGPAAGIRREYISLVRMHPEGARIPGTYTPSQIELAVAGEEAREEEWQEIHQLYEKARFAPQLADRNDLRRMRELVRRRSEAERRRQEMVRRRLL